MLSRMFGRPVDIHSLMQDEIKRLEDAIAEFESNYPGQPTPFSRVDMVRVASFTVTENPDELRKCVDQMIRQLL